MKEALTTQAGAPKDHSSITPLIYGRAGIDLEPRHRVRL